VGETWFKAQEGWLPYRPDLPDTGAHGLFRKASRAIARSRVDVANRIAFDAGRAGHVATEAAIRVLIDLVEHGWRVRVSQQVVQVLRPASSNANDESLRERVRAQHQRARYEQLRSPSVQKFLRSVETRRLHNGQFVSIFSLMRDGRELADSLAQLRSGTSVDPKALEGIIRPTLEFVSDGATCGTTGMRLQDIWRYFRHTWANAYGSVPGRSIMILVRDDAHPMRPVIGIAALGSAVVQSTVRDRWIGWDADDLVEELAAQPRAQDADWLSKLIDRGLSELYHDDFIASELLAPTDLRSPRPETIKALQELAISARLRHHAGDPKERKRAHDGDDDSDDHWSREATSDLFTSKRASTLASLLTARIVLDDAYNGRPSAGGLRRLLSSAVGRRVAATLIRRAKTEAIGISIADITVCGAIAPYNHLLGGKLIAMLLTSPEVVAAYEKRYAKSKSVIASSLAGRAIQRPPRLVVLSTTSLYATPLNQYMRIAIPGSIFSDQLAETIRYVPLGTTLGFGSFQFSKRTTELLSDLQLSATSSTVNWVFGEGVNPRMRAIREGLDSLGLASDQFLNHGSPRIVYGVSLARNARAYLLGRAKRPEYFMSPSIGPDATRAIARYWGRRWLAGRILRDDVLDKVACERLVYPIRHNARVALPPSDQLDLLE